MEAPTEYSVDDAEDGTTTISVAGPLDAYTAPDFASLIAKQDGPTVIRLAEVTFCDSSGIRSLIEAARAGHTVDVDGASRPVQRVVDLTAVRDLLTGGGLTSAL